MQKNQILILLMIFFTLFLIGCSQEAEQNKTITKEQAKNDTTTTLNKYYSSIDYSCKADSDCEIKDVRNCCGYYPQCVNKNAATDPRLVNALCQAEGSASICGFEEISKCWCINNRCESSP